MDLGSYQTIGFNAAAGAVQELNIAGNYLACLQASEATFNIKIGDSAASLFAAGLKLRAPIGQQFSTVTIDNTAGTGTLTGTMAYGAGDFSDQRFIDATALLATLTSEPDAACAPAAATQVLGADSNRQSVTISNLGTNVREVRVGDSNVAAGQGYELPAGQSITLNTTAALYVYNPHTAAQSVAVLVTEA